MTEAHPAAAAPSGRVEAALVAGGSAALLGGALISQFGFGLAPCELCLLQRIPHDIAIPLALIALLWARGRTWLLALAGVALLVGVGIAAYHAGVELRWWEGPTACTGASSGGSVADLLRSIETSDVVRCDEVAFAFLGLSMAAWNGLLSAGLVAIALRPAAMRLRAMKSGSVS
ncbi:disulfide bond formation protein B [Zavarzinia sp. CC-PAN008]|uniref:disulfide bond formation protein B n=1 Tax=Zavarzinia sp. CC-PAN008 TaxID=3243332 RepID=UPI003F74554A